MKFIVLSDIHVGKGNNLERYDECIDWIIKSKTKHKCETVLNCGDIVDDGALYQFRQASQGLQKLSDAGFKVLSIPGNHDYGRDGIEESGESREIYNEYIGGWSHYPARVDVGNTAFILLDSMKEEMRNVELWGAQGELGERQLRDLDAILTEIESTDKKKKIVVALHHHPFYYNFFLTLRDNRLFKRVITVEGGKKARVDCIIFGHKHKEMRFLDKEKKYKVDMIYASGATTEVLRTGKLRIPVVDLRYKKIVNHDI